MKLLILLILPWLSLSRGDTVKSYPEYELVKKPLLHDYRLEEVILKREVVQGEYLGLPIRFKDQDIYIDKDNKVNIKPFKVKIKATSSLMINENLFRLKQTIHLKREPFHYFSEKNQVLEQVIELKKDDELYTDYKGRYLLKKRYQPHPFTYSFLWMENSYSEYLKDIKYKLYQFDRKTVCFLDNYLKPSPYDCEHLAFKVKAPYGYTTFKILMIDLNVPSIEIVKDSQ